MSAAHSGVNRFESGFRPVACRYECSLFADLHPSAVTVADLIERITMGSCPGSPEQQQTHFCRHGSVAVGVGVEVEVEVEVEIERSPQVTCGQLLVPDLENTKAPWTALHGQLSFINFFPFGATLERPARAETGYEAIRAEPVPRPLKDGRWSMMIDRQQRLSEPGPDYDQTMTVPGVLARHGDPFDPKQQFL